MSQKQESNFISSNAQKLLWIFALSGAAALLYELVAARTLITVFGGMADAIATVLATYMVGLSLGAYLGGKLADRAKSPLRIYAMAEVVIAATILLLPWGRDLILEIYVNMVRSGISESVDSILRVALSSLLLLPPTLAMGATLPLLVSDWMRRDPQATRAVPRLYGANTLGAALGVLIGTYILLPVLGITRTLVLVAGLDLIAAVLALNIAREIEAIHPAIAPPAEESTESDELITRPALLLVAVGCGSLILFAFEVLWTHVMAVVIGNSIYCFGVMLFAVLWGLASGGKSAEKIPREKQVLALGRNAALFAAVVAISLLLWDLIPLVFVFFGKHTESFWSRELVRFGICTVMLFPPAWLSGRIYALAVALYAGPSGGVGQRIGQVSAASTVGAVIGSLLGSFVLLPHVGSLQSFRLGGMALLGCAALYLAATRSTAAERKQVISIGAMVTLLLVFLPTWNIDRLSDGSNVHFGAPWGGHTVYIHEDKFGGLTTVRKSDEMLTLLTNGKFQGNNDSEMADQRAFAIFPLLHVNRFRKALVIGLGTGVSAATVRWFPFESLTVAEISPGIIEAAERYFGDINEKLVPELGDQIKQQDGRHWLLVTEDKYDLISMELSSIWFAGSAALYNREFYKLAQSRLTDDGIFQQWVQLHFMYPADLASVFASIRAAFPHVSLYVAGHQGVLVASDTPLIDDPEKLDRWCNNPQYARACNAFPNKKLAPLLDQRVLNTFQIDAFIAHTAKEHGLLPDDLISTDDSVYLEYSTPRGNILGYNSGKWMLKNLRKYSDLKSSTDTVK